MPYIKQEDRVGLDPLIDQLAEQIDTLCNGDKSRVIFDDYLHFAICELVRKVVIRQFSEIRYWIIAIVSGVFKNAGDEFGRRVGALSGGYHVFAYGKADNYAELDSSIDKLAGQICELCKPDDSEKVYTDHLGLFVNCLALEKAFAGYLNYCMTRLALKVVDLQYGQMHNWVADSVHAVFKHAGDDFYRHLGVPYEEQQIKKNGDVDLYAAYDNRMS